MTLSIIIVNWRSKDHLRACLRTVRATAADLSPQVIVVDGASFDGCGEMLAAEFPEVTFIQSQENLGFGRCNNLGFERSASDLVLFLNPDTELKVNCLQTMLAELERRPDAGILCPRILNPDGSLQTTCVRALPTPLNRAIDSTFFRRLLPNSRLWGIGQAFRAAEPIEVEAVSGAFMLMRAEVFRRVGGFTPAYFMYGEDMDLCAKIGRSGLKIVFVPRAEIIHHGGISSSQQDSEFPTENMRVGWDLYMRRNHGPATAVWYRFLQVVSALVRMALLLPACAIGGRSSRTDARASLQKWAYVLRWAGGQHAHGEAVHGSGSSILNKSMLADGKEY